MADRIGHAYLFCGTRGTGKTTVAKLFAKAVNCEHPIDGSPCGTCSSCRAIAEGSSMNVIEIDAASNNGVDNIREIREQVRYSPTEGKYKVYIIDEVHMLSIGAFNALLKTLEEPPSYVIFILATTEAHKIPITILSRCQRYDFRRISIQTIADRLSIPTEVEHVELPVSTQQLEHIFHNILTNSYDAICKKTESGYSKNTISIQTELHPKSLQIKVQDTGCGMTQPQLSKVLNPGVTYKKNGHGIGLPLVLEIMESIHGEFHISSSPGRGTTITLLFPL